MPTSLALFLLITTLANPARGQVPVQQMIEMGDMPVQIPEVVNLTRGFRYAPPINCIGISQSDPKVVYVGTGSGYIYVSRDGGLSWEERRVRTGRGRFLGAVRPTGDGLIDRKIGPAHFSPDTGHYRAEESYDPPLKVDNAKIIRPSNLFKFLQLLPDEESISPVPIETSHHIRDKVDNILLGRTDGYWRFKYASAGEGSRLGVGLRKAAKWLTLALRKKRSWAMGVNIKQMLSLYAYERIEVFWLDVHPENPNDILAATGSGLLRSTDGGESWPTVLPGATLAERNIKYVGRNPHNPKEVYVGSYGGLFISRDDGVSFYRVVDQRLAWMPCWVVAFHPTRPEVIYVGTDYGMFRSTDGGENFEWTFVRPHPLQNELRRMVVDAGDPDLMMIGTRDGLFKSEDGGVTFSRTGGLVMTAEYIYGLTTSGRPGHFVAVTRQDVWETTDRGNTWRILYYGANEWTHNWAIYDPMDNNKLWLINWAEVLQLVPRRVKDLPRDLLEKFRQLIQDEPTSMESIRIALKRAGLDRPSQLNPYRRRAMLKALVPKIEAGVFRRSIDGLSTRAHRLYANWDSSTPAFGNQNSVNYIGFAVLAYWDLSTLVFNKESVPVDRYFNYWNSPGTWKGEAEFRHTIKEMYLERRRLQLEGLIERTEDFRTKLYRDLRIEELTAHLNQLCGDVFEPYWAF